MILPTTANHLHQHRSKRRESGQFNEDLVTELQAVNCQNFIKIRAFPFGAPRIHDRIVGGGERPKVDHKN